MSSRIKHIKTTTFDPQSNRSLERAHPVVKDLLKTAITDNRTEWDLNQKIICMAYNIIADKTTGYTPFELTFGRKENLASTLATMPSLFHDELENLWKKGIKMFSRAWITQTIDFYLITKNT